MEVPYTAWVDVEALSSNSQSYVNRRQRFCKKSLFVILSVAAIAGVMFAGSGVFNVHAAISSDTVVHDVLLAEQDEHEKGVCYVVHLLSGPVGDWLFSRYAAKGMDDITACFERLPGSALLGCIFAPFIVPAFLLVLSCIGFGPVGVIAGSCAASWQATMGGFVAAGSCFAWLQSCAAAGCCAACARAWPVLLAVCLAGICLTSSLTLHCACGWL
mmetsp:Transcript_11448/g.12852  ORF Transcript_11448/g.12852 Transcript_11448/m.12852 type:complete len:215 (-) Transcript_11448:49-693(-)